MAKHPHKLLLINNGKTWKCILDGCSFFVHRGLEPVLIGKHAICWGCGETFVVDEYALKDGKPMCVDCRPVKIAEPVVQTAPSTDRTPEQQQAYENLMAEMFGKDWRSRL